MTTQEVANRYVELCRAGEYQKCYEELFSPDVVSIENDGTTHTGFEEIAQKGKEWNESLEEFQGAETGDAVVSGNTFAVPSFMNVKFKGAPAVTKFEEIGIFQVRNGKIYKEQFFYEDQAPPA